jgi:hypothetical protein
MYRLRIKGMTIKENAPPPVVGVYWIDEED